ncbi:MAG: GntR family transcriptional regulator [Muribaculaceae bacterium]|nr:GntR family transcriptional regulator [Bacteroides sp.]MDE6804653.1 GntR family transcriptional regulator [Muribaculaceae bacterium]MDE6842679.1 GntR family transcriptional regulator [Muribaculaceae bacterium]MDE7190620.1 GntR family transcriptional regulator [Muribaculaceae bacterium]
MFKENSKAIYLQIVDRICDEILGKVLNPEDRMPSVREYAATVQVNPNTMMRAYDYLSSLGIIYNRRGIGFFVSAEAPEEIHKMRVRDMFGERLLEVFRELQLLGISPETLKKRYEEYLSSNSTK